MSKRAEEEHLTKISEDENARKKREEKLRKMIEGNDQEKLHQRNFLKAEMEQMIRLKEALLFDKAENIFQKN